jgi:hypothetical protein
VSIFSVTFLRLSRDEAGDLQMQDHPSQQLKQLSIIDLITPSKKNAAPVTPIPPSAHIWCEKEQKIVWPKPDALKDDNANISPLAF